MPQTQFRGTGLKNEDFQKKKVLTTHYIPRLNYAWDTGVAVGRYLQELKRGRLIARRCGKCERVVVPPREFCEYCFVPMAGWQYVQDTGRVNTFSLCYVTWDMKRVKDPQIPAVIEIDGCSKEVGIMHLLGEVRPQDIKIGMKVKAVWKKPEDRQGAITDILYFKPMK